MAINRQRTKPKGSIIRKRGSRYLYFLFYYHGRRVEKSTGLIDTKENHIQAEKDLASIMERIERGTFRFSEAFPRAKENEKEYFSSLEGTEQERPPETVMVLDYLEKWFETDYPLLISPSCQIDYKKIIHAWIRPYFKNMTFADITESEVKRFILTMRQRPGITGKGLSRSTVNNVLIVLKALWRSARDNYKWLKTPYPFLYIKRFLPKTGRIHRESFSFDNWTKLLDAIEPFYRPHCELMLLTGMIHSEMAGLRITDLTENVIQVRHKISRGIESDRLRTEYRERDIPITRAIRRVLDELLKNTQGPYVVTMRDGGNFTGEKFRRIWRKARKNAGIPYLVPYCMRHTFAYWSLLIGIPTMHMVELMGHNDKKMIFEVYAKGQKGLVKDREKILAYMGKDYVDYYKGSPFRDEKWSD